VPSWEPDFAKAQSIEGHRRRTNAWITLALAFFGYLTFVGVRNLLW
jgi:hypothetical protein